MEALSSGQQMMLKQSETRQSAIRSEICNIFFKTPKFVDFLWNLEVNQKPDCILVAEKKTVTAHKSILSHVSNYLKVD